MTSNSLTNELTGASVQTDHGGLGMGDLIVLLLDAVLLVYTAFRSYDYLSTTVPDGFSALALVGLWGLDFGAIGWSLVWMFGSTAKYQDWISMTFFVIDLLGVVLTSITDSLMYNASGDEMTIMLKSITSIAIPLVIVGNVIAGFIYHMTSPRTKAMRAKRKSDTEHSIKMQDIVNMERDLLHAEQYLLAKQDALEKQVLLAEMKVQQDSVEKATRAKLRDQTGISAAAKNSGAPDDDQSQVSELKRRLQEMGQKITSLGETEQQTGASTNAPASNSTPAQTNISTDAPASNLTPAQTNINMDASAQANSSTDAPLAGTEALVEPAIVSGNGHKPVSSPI